VAILAVFRFLYCIISLAQNTTDAMDGRYIIYYGARQYGKIRVQHVVGEIPLSKV